MAEKRSAAKCGNCKWWKNQSFIAPSKRCMVTQFTFVCDKWFDKNINALCSNCAHFKTSACDETNANSLCSDFSEIKPYEVEKYSKDSIIKKINDGTLEADIAKDLGVFIDPKYTAPLKVDDPQVHILKHHHNSLLTMMPALELAVRQRPTMASANAYISFLNASIHVMSEINNRRSPEDQYAELHNAILKPLLECFLKSFTENSREFLHSMNGVTMEGKEEIMKKLVARFMENSATSFRKDLDSILKKLQEKLGVVNGGK